MHIITVAHINTLSAKFTENFLDIHNYNRNISKFSKCKVCMFFIQIFYFKGKIQKNLAYTFDQHFDV